MAREDVCERELYEKGRSDAYTRYSRVIIDYQANSLAILWLDDIPFWLVCLILLLREK